MSKVSLKQLAQSGATSAQGARFNTTSGLWEPKTIGLILIAEQSGGYTASVGERVPWNTSGGTFALTAPPTPNSGDEWGAFENVSNATVLTIPGNGKDIESPSGGFAPSFTVAVADTSLVWIYNGTRWKLIVGGV